MTTYPVHKSYDALRTVCGRVADLRCVGPEDWESVTCVECDDITQSGPRVDMSAAMRAELPEA